MAIRTCPSCRAVIPARIVVAYSNDLVCPGCGRPLEISAISRDFSVAAGLVAAAATWVWTSKLAGAGALGWVLLVLYPFLAFSVVAPLILMTTADLRIRQDVTTQAPADPAHSSSHDSSAAHS